MVERDLSNLSTGDREPITVLPYTDIARDPDDATGFTYLKGFDNVRLAGVATTHMIPERRALVAHHLLSTLGDSDTPIGTGSVYPLGQEENTALRDHYQREHQLHGTSYEGHGLLEYFPEAPEVGESKTAVEVIHGAIAAYGSSLNIAALAPLTDLAKAAREDRRAFCRVGGLFIQGQAIVEDGRLAPDPAAYNLKEDMIAANEIFDLQDHVPITLIGKAAAYQVPLESADFQAYAATGHPAGRYLNTHAQDSMACFKERAPQIQAMIYGPDGRFGGRDVLSVPYDVLALKAIVDPSGLEVQHVGHHTLIGNSSGHPGITPAQGPMIKDELHATILHALR